MFLSIKDKRGDCDRYGNQYRANNYYFSQCAGMEQFHVIKQYKGKEYGKQQQQRDHALECRLRN